METDCLIDVIWAAPCVLNLRWELLFVKGKSDFEEHFDREESQDCTGCFAGSTSADDHDISVFSDDIFFLLGKLDFEVGDFG